jgi:hypothetical protein
MRHFKPCFLLPLRIVGTFKKEQRLENLGLIIKNVFADLDKIKLRDCLDPAGT